MFAVSVRPDDIPAKTRAEAFRDAIRLGIPQRIWSAPTWDSCLSGCPLGGHELKVLAGMVYPVLSQEPSDV